MKTSQLDWRVWRWCLALAFSLGFVASSSGSLPATPKILTIRAAGTNLAVTVSVPKGWRSVVLESRQNPKTGAWVPCAITRSVATAGLVTLKVPLALRGQTLRARGQLSEPLPASFYRGKQSFGGRRTGFWRPDLGRGEVFALSADVGLPSGAVPTGAATTARTVVESDIWQRSGDTLYFFNQLRGLQVLDIHNPDAPVLRGTLALPAVGEQMYLLDPQHVVLLTRDGCSSDWQSRLLIVDVSTEVPAIIAALPVDGWVQESRLVGTALYVASQGYLPAPNSTTGEWRWGTTVAAFDLANPATPVARPSLWFGGQDNAVLATDRLLFVATQNYQTQPAVQIIDIAAPDGTLQALASVPTTGAVADKFKLNLAGDVLTTIADSFDPTATNALGGLGAWVTTLETFSLTQPATPVPLGRLELARGERLFATRFDGTRAYIVTFHQVDPLWVVDLSDPAQPVVAGAVEVPGWSTYILPMGDRLLTLGVETNRVAVSLFDVHDPAQPALLSRVPLGENWSWSEANYDEKALTVLSDLGLVLVPYSGNTTNGYANRVQLIDLGANSLQARGIIEHRCQPRRTAAHRGRVLSLSSTELLTTDVTDRDHPAATAETELAWAANRVFVQNDSLLELANGDGGAAGGKAMVRVSALAKPDVILGRYDLGNRPVVGSALRGGRLYLLQRPDDFYSLPWTVLSEGGPSATAPSTNFLMTVLDVSAPPAIGLLGQLAIAPTDVVAGSFEAVWPTSDLLVWFSSGAGLLFNPLADARAVGVLPAGGAMNAVSSVRAAAAIPFWRPWWSDGVRLLAVNVSNPGQPQLTSKLALNPPNAWGFSRPLAAQGLVYFSHEQSAYESVLQSWGRVSSDWRMHESLDVIDYSDPAAPTVRPSLGIPGQLTGLSDDGSMLYLLGAALTTSGATVESREALHACAYDGVGAYLVDSLPLPTTWPRPVLLSHGRVYLGRAAADANGAQTLEAWALSGQGRFQRQALAKLSQPVSALAGFGSLVAAQAANIGVTLFDASTASALSERGQGGPTECLWFDLNRADGSASAGVWIPLDDYGIGSVPLAPATSSAAPAK